MSMDDTGGNAVGGEGQVGDFEAEHNRLLEDIMALPEAARSIKLLSAAKAALMLDCSVVTLERRRKEGLPPPPAPNYAGGKKGSEVKYLASTLVEFIRGLPISQPSPYPAKADPSILASNAAASAKAALARTGAKRHLQKYCNGLDVEEDAALMPFYISMDGLVLSPCWDEPVAMFEAFWDDATDVAWRPWAEALAAVWQEEATRQEWLETADQLAPGLSQRAEAIRHKRLSSI